MDLAAQKIKPTRSEIEGSTDAKQISQHWSTAPDKLANSPLAEIKLSNTNMFPRLVLTPVKGSSPMSLHLEAALASSEVRFDGNLIDKSGTLFNEADFRDKCSTRSLVEGLGLSLPCSSTPSLLQPQYSVKRSINDFRKVRKLPIANYPEAFGLQKIREVFESNPTPITVDLPGLRLKGNHDNVTAEVASSKLRRALGLNDQSYSGTPQAVFTALCKSLGSASGEVLISEVSPPENVSGRLDRVLGLKFPIILKPSVGCQSGGVLEVHKQPFGRFKIKTSCLGSALALSSLVDSYKGPGVHFSLADTILAVKEPFARAIARVRTAIYLLGTRPRVNYATTVKNSDQLRQLIRDFYKPSDEEGTHIVDVFIAEEKFKVGSVLGFPVEWRFISHGTRYDSAPKIWAKFACMPDGMLPKAAALLTHGAHVSTSLFRLLLAHGGIRAAWNIRSEYRRLMDTVDGFIKNLNSYSTVSAEGTNSRTRCNLPDLAIDVAPVWNKETRQFDYYLIELFPVFDSKIRPRIPGLFFVNPVKWFQYPPWDSD